MHTLMNVCVLHNKVPPEAAPDEQDVLIQAAEISETLQRMGHGAFRLSAGLDCSSVLSNVRSTGAGIVFNLVESLAGSDALIHLYPGLFEAEGIPFTGSSAAALFLTSNKLVAKRIMDYARIPTPGHIDLSAPCIHVPKPGTYIVKSTTEHASIGLGSDCVIEIQCQEDAQTARTSFADRFRSDRFFAEAFIPGREFNLSMLDGPQGPEVLPPAEIIFTNFGTNPVIVDYSAKWSDSSPEYSNTQRSFTFEETDRELLESLRATALVCWHEFGLRGYARVDFRVDVHGRPWVLEINANPCLARDAGLMAAAKQSGLTPEAVVERILQANSLS
jgi:D-alanine-D-alanine ligase